MRKHQGSQAFANESVIKLGNYAYNENDVLGYGFESVVYKGHHIMKKHQVAVKAVDMTNLRQGINKVHFENEIKCLENLKSTPHILNLHEKVEKNEMVYLITELCVGDLSDQIDKGLDSKQIWQYMKQLSKGFIYLWKQNIIHRDIKPKNLFINARNDIKYGDFGFAVKQSELYKQKKYNVGSPAYMSPEAFKFNEYSHLSDVWAIGIIFYQMWTGTLPWNCSTEEQLEKRMNDKFISGFISKGPFDQKSKILLSKMLKVNPKERMTAEQLMDFFNDKKKQEGKKKLINKSLNIGIKNEGGAELIGENQEIQLSSPLWQFKKKKEEPEKPKGFSLTLKPMAVGGQKQDTPEKPKLQEKKRSKYERPKSKVQQPEIQQPKVKVVGPKPSPIRTFNAPTNFNKTHRQEPQTAIITNIKKVQDAPFSPDVRRRGKNPMKKMKVEDNPNFVTNYILQLAENFFNLFIKLESYPHSDKAWCEHIPLLKSSYKNSIVKITSEIMALQPNSKFLSQFCSTSDIKKYLESEEYLITKEQCENMIQSFKENKQIEAYWPKAKQNNFLGIMNSTISFLEVLKPNLMNNTKKQLEIALMASVIAKKVSSYLSSELKDIKNEKDDSATIRLQKNKICQKIDDAIESRRKLFD